jgi:hypothetical protein
MDAKANRSRSIGVFFLVAVVLLAAGALGIWKLLDNARPSETRSGTTLTLVPEPLQPTGGAVTAEQVARTVALLEQRLDSLGLAGRSVTSHGTGAHATIVLRTSDANQRSLLTDVSATGHLDFRSVLLSGSPTPTVTATGGPSGTGVTAAERQASTDSTAPKESRPTCVRRTSRPSLW